MSAGTPAGEEPPAGQAGASPSEEELRAAYEAELARITTTDMMLQAVVSLLNIGARRLAPAPEAGQAGTPGSGRDLEQVRDAIDGVTALLEVLERRIPQELRSLRDALSQLQMAYAREVQAGAGGEGGPAGGSGEGEGPPGGPSESGAGAPPEGGEQRRPGPAESTGRLWIPGR